LQTDGAKPMKAGYGKAGKQKTLSNFPTATTTTNYNYLWDTDSEGKVTLRGFAVDYNVKMAPHSGRNYMLPMPLHPRPRYPAHTRAFMMKVRTPAAHDRLTGTDRDSSPRQGRRQSPARWWQVPP
jgi:hypothetical protein